MLEVLIAMATAFAEVDFNYFEFRDDFRDNEKVMIIEVLVMAIAMATDFTRVDFSFFKCAKL